MRTLDACKQLATQWQQEPLDHLLLQLHPQGKMRMWQAQCKIQLASRLHQNQQNATLKLMVR